MTRCPSCSRRNFVRLALGGPLATALFPRAAAARSAPAKSCILLWMQGAQSQIDTFDLKPGTETGGPFKEIPTAADGVRICEHLPRLARQMDKVSLVRSLHSKDPNHDTATTMLHTGHRRNSALERPHLGSVLLHELGAGKTDLPGCIVLGGEPPAGAAYLPAERSPAVFDKLENPGEDVLPSTEYFPAGTLERRWKLLQTFDPAWVRAHEDARVEARRRAYERAWSVLSSTDLDAFRTAREPEPVRKAYGDSPFGRGLLLARRLVERGVRFVEVQIGSWDSHADNFTAHRRLMGEIDGPVAALLEDLHRSGLLSETLVLLLSEFGRTPRVNGAQGRDHWTRNWCGLAGGAGVAGGRVVGATDRLGMEVADRPVSVADLFATIYRACGVDPRKEHRAGGGRPVPILEEGEPVAELLG